MKKEEENAGEKVAGEKVIGQKAAEELNKYLIYKLNIYT